MSLATIGHVDITPTGLTTGTGVAVTGSGVLYDMTNAMLAVYRAAGGYGDQTDPTARPDGWVTLAPDAEANVTAQNVAANVRTVKSNISIANAAAAQAGAIVGPIATWLTTNAVVNVTIGTGASGLQRTPSPNNANTDTQGPSTPKTLTGSIT